MTLDSFKGEVEYYVGFFKYNIIESKITSTALLNRLEYHIHSDNYWFTVSGVWKSDDSPKRIIFTYGELDDPLRESFVTVIHDTSSDFFDTLQIKFDTHG